MRRTAAFVALVLSCLPYSMSVRAHQGEPPYSLQIQQSSASQPIPLFTLGKIDKSKLLSEDARQPLAVNASSVMPHRFALPADVSITPETHGKWSDVPGGR